MIMSNQITGFLTILIFFCGISADDYGTTPQTSQEENTFSSDDCSKVNSVIIYILCLYYKILIR